MIHPPRDARGGVGPGRRRHRLGDFGFGGFYFCSFGFCRLKVFAGSDSGGQFCRFDLCYRSDCGWFGRTDDNRVRRSTFRRPGAEPVWQRLADAGRAAAQQPAPNSARGKRARLRRRGAIRNRLHHERLDRVAGGRQQKLRAARAAGVGGCSVRPTALRRMRSAAAPPRVGLFGDAGAGRLTEASLMWAPIRSRMRASRSEAERPPSTTATM